MKIMIATFLFEPSLGGGAAQVANQLAFGLVQEGHQVVVLTTWGGRSVQSEVKEGVKIIRLPASNLYWIADKEKKPFLLKALWQLIDTWNPWIFRLARKVIAEEKPDVFHSHKLRGLSPSIWIAAANAGIESTIHTCHDYEAISPEGLLISRIGQLAINKHFLLRPYQLIRRNASKVVNVVTSPSQFTLSIHQKMDFFPNSQITTVPNSHGLSQSEVCLIQSNHQKERHGSPDKPMSLLFIGRLEKEKGILFLCEVFTKLSSINPSIILDIAGFGSLQTILPKLYGNLPNVQFHGPAFGDKKEKLFERCDVTIVPSLCNEVSPVIIPEAYSRGIPVIISNKGGMPEIVENERTGYIFEAGNERELIELLLKLAAEPQKVRGLSDTCFDYSKQFSHDRILGNYLDLYSSTKT